MSAPKRWDLAGCGSANVDWIHRCDRILGPESKGRILGAQRRPGGVVANHLGWAAALGSRVALFGHGGSDAEGAWLRSELHARRVDCSHWRPSGHPTGRALIFVDLRGERAIYLLDGANAVARASDAGRFDAVLRLSRALSTEVSQLRLGFTWRLLARSAKLGLPSFLDLDIPPSQATARGGLGNRAELARALRACTHLKSSVDHAMEWTGQGRGGAATALHRALGKGPGQRVFLTDGRRGSEACDGVEAWRLPALKGLAVIDSTGAGDAYFGGMIHAGLGGVGLLDSACLAAAVASLKLGIPGGSPPVGLRPWPKLRELVKRIRKSARRLN